MPITQSLPSDQSQQKEKSLENIPSSAVSTVAVNQTNKKGPLVIIAVIIILLILVAGSFGYIFMSKSKNKAITFSNVENENIIKDDLISSPESTQSSLQTLEDLMPVPAPKGYYLDIFFTTTTAKDVLIGNILVADPWMKSMFMTKLGKVTIYTDMGKWQSNQLVYQYFITPSNPATAMKMEIKTRSTDEIVKLNKNYEKKNFRLVGEETVNGFLSFKFYDIQSQTYVWYTKEYHLLTRVQGTKAGRVFEVFQGNTSPSGTYNGQDIIKIDLIHRFELPTQQEVQLPENITVINQGTFDYSQFNWENN